MSFTLDHYRGSERRQFQRCTPPRGSASLCLRRQGRQRFTLRGTVHNISQQGICFHVDGPLDVGEVVEVKVMLAGAGTDLVRATGRVIRLDASEPHAPSWLAVAFTDIHEPADPELLGGWVRGATGAEQGPPRAA